jgi:hypothetical protein
MGSMLGVDLEAKMYFDKDYGDLYKLCEKFGLYFHEIYNYEENKTQFRISSPLYSSTDIKKCIDWIIEEFEEK